MKKAIFTILYLVPSILFAGNSERAGFDFLRIDMGARPSAMAGAFVAVDGDVHGLFYNPASLIGISGRQAVFTYQNYLMDLNTGLAGYHIETGSGSHLAFGLAYLSYGEMQKTSVDGEILGTFSPGDFSITAAYADQLPFGLRYGVAVRFIQSKIDDYSASAFCGDLGLLYRIETQNLNFGISLSNIGKAFNAFLEKHEKLPSSLRFGMSKRLAHLPLLFNLNFIKYFDMESGNFWGLYWILGGEFTISENVWLRLGYHSRGREQKTEGGNDQLAGISMGLGLKVRNYRIDYALNVHGILGNVNALTISIPF